MNFINITLIITVVLTGLIAGLFYSYSCSVNLGLGRLADKEYLEAMQHINKEILNPAFFIIFTGTLIMLPACSGLLYNNGGATPTFWIMLAAAILYVGGHFCCYRFRQCAP